MRISGFVFAAMSQIEARHVSGWRYPPPYDFYDMAAEEDDLAAWILPGGEEGRYSVRLESAAEGEPVGFFSFGEDTRVPGGEYPSGALDIGLGMRPDITGRGIGHSFFEAGMDFARRRFQPTRFRLSVAKFNQRAISVYERAGFVRTISFVQPGRGTDFIQMERRA